MYYVKTDENNVVIYATREIDGLPEDFVETLFTVEYIPPSPEQQIGKSVILKADKDTRTAWFEYVDRPLTAEEKVQLLEQENQDLKNRIDLMQQALDELLLGGM
jgi:hypothetical protein